MLYTTGADKSLCSWNMNSLSEQKRIAVSANIYVLQTIMQTIPW
jgi:hypothetical protein